MGAKMEKENKTIQNELESAEQSLVKQANVHFVEGFIKPKRKPKGGKRTRKRKQ